MKNFRSELLHTIDVLRWMRDHRIGVLNEEAAFSAKRFLFVFPDNIRYELERFNDKRVSVLRIDDPVIFHDAYADKYKLCAASRFTSYVFTARTIIPEAVFTEAPKSPPYWLQKDLVYRCNEKLFAPMHMPERVPLILEHADF